MMENIVQLEACTGDLAAAVNTLARYRRGGDATNNDAAASGTGPQPLVARDAPSEAHRARRSIKANVAKLQVLIDEPTDFLRQLAAQNQLLACLQWLGGFQVLACIPLSGSVPLEDVADIAGVPEAQLCRVVHTTATAGFLRQPQPGLVAHTPLSAPFVTKPSFLDAGMFLSETAAPAALQMAAAARRFEHSQRPNESAYNVAFNTSSTFSSACEQSSQMQRKWQAYLKHGIGDSEASVREVLIHLDWASLGHVTVVDVGARSTALATALVGSHPSLRFIVQMSDSGVGLQPARPSTPATPLLNRSMDSLFRIGDPQQQLNGRITVQYRSPGSLQTVHDAAVYIYGVPSTSPGLPSRVLLARISAELKAHMAVLRENSSATLVLTAHLLPEPGAVDPDVEAVARLRDLMLVQLANEHEIEASEVMEVLNSMRDENGRLVLVNKFHSSDNATTAFEIRYRLDTERQSITPSERSGRLYH